MDVNNLGDAVGETEKVQTDPTLLSDVIDVIKQDSEFAEPPDPAVDSSTMFNGGGTVPMPVRHQGVAAADGHQHKHRKKKVDAYIEIVEQPAPKALRFRYECEGRSAGSIPGVNSTSDKKTFPTIRVVGYSGNAWVLVSCVTKDSPYRPHPHNLVGREGCTSGICRLQIPPDTMTISFPNLGIQCVKKKDIAQALDQRQRLQVDPFKTGYSHRDQPTSIDLNSVRLCFQVFLPDENNKYNTALKPVVSEPIYDKKAMSDLSITKLSHCNSYVDGGRKHIILLCEKVAKDDIQIRFFEKHGDWEAYADIQPSNVHHQYAIWFQPPKYKTLDVTEPVPVCLQLRRPSDGACSEPVDFEFLPLDSGRPPYWSYRRNIPPKKANYNLFNAILANDAKLLMKRQLGCFPEETTDKNVNIVTDKPVQESIQMETNNNNVAVSSKESDYSEVKKQKVEEKTFNEIINQVAQLDEIYADAKARLLNDTLTDVDKPVVISEMPYNESFDDAKTYSSLQLAFKNPVEIESSRYEDVAVELPSPIIDIIANVTNNKRENDSEKLPPLPPKRTKKIETYIGGSVTSINKQADVQRNVTVGRSQSFNMQRPKWQLEGSPLDKNLPPTPTSTLPNPKKRGFLSKLFGRKSKTPGQSRETSVARSTNSNLFSSSKSLHPESLLAKSTGNISTTSATSIRIPLKDSPPSSTPNLLSALDTTVPKDVTMEDIDLNLDLTEAEHYALYTAMAPHATQSEFDEMSCYYAPVEGGRLLTTAEEQ